jgi:hypothetical protein
MAIHHRAIEKVRKEGIRPFLASIPDAVTTYARQPITRGLASGVDAGLCGPLVDESELECIARERGNWFEFEDANTFEIPAQEGLPEELLEHSGTYGTRRRFIAELPDTLLFGHDALAVDGDNRLVLESIGGHQWYVAYVLYRYMTERRLNTVGKLLNRSSIRREQRYGTVFPLLGPHSRTYFHWIAECLPRLRAFEDWRKATGETATILVNPDPPEWKIESLRCLGFDDSQWAEWDGTGVAERVLVAPYSPKRPSLLAPSPDDYRWLRDRMCERATEPSIGRPDAIFVSRRDAPNRDVRNEDVLLGELESSGLTRVIPSEFSIPEQVMLFAEAEMVVGPHGAGLVNTIFSDQIRVIECFQSDLIRPYFYHLAMELGHEYDCILAERQGRDMVVPVDEFRKRILM